MNRFIQTNDMIHQNEVLGHVVHMPGSFLVDLGMLHTSVGVQKAMSCCAK